MSNNLEAAVARIERLEREWASIKSSVGRIGDDVKELGNKVAMLEREVNMLKSKVMSS